MVKKALTLLTSILFALHLLMPFNIYADSLPQSEIVGVSWNLIDTEISLSPGGNWYTYTYELEVKLKNKYVGVVDGTLSYTYSDVQGTSSNPTSKTSTTTKRNYVNGDSFKFNIYISNIGQQFTGNGPMYNCSYLINNSTTNVTKYEDLNSIESVVNVLSDIYQNSSDIEGLSNNQLTELQNIIVKLNLGNEYLETLTKIRQWNVPIESVPFVYSSLYYEEPVDLYKFGYNSLYPLFNPSTDTYISRIFMNINHTYDIIFISRGGTVNGFNQVFKLIDTEGLSNYTFTEYKQLNTIFLKYDNKQSYAYLIKAKIQCNKASDYFLIGNTNDFPFIPIYFNDENNKNISTDFALQYGLSNKLLDNLDVIANGTAQSSSAASSNDLANEQLQTDSNTLFQQENGFKSDMNNAMNNVNTTFRLQDMGTKFVSSAQWVRTQYEQLTNNTPFASLITFSLITGLALILLGKVYK